VTRRLPFLLHPALVAALVVPASIGISSSADAATPRCAGFKATIVGTNASQKINGTNGRDVIVARGGNDVVNGRGGLDIVCGGAGNDTILSGAGAGGLLHGEDGRDTIVAQAEGLGIYGGNHDDVLRSTKRGTLFEGGAGNDRIEGSPFPDVIDGGPGNDHVLANGGADKLVTGGSGNDKLYGGDGTDVLRGGPGADQLTLGAGVGGFGFGEDGNDTIVAGDDGQAIHGNAGNDLMKTAFEGSLLEGGTGDDRLYGGGYADVITAGDGDDVISAAGGDDVELNGGFGTDTCDGGPGTDNCNGGAPGGPANSPTDPDLCTAEVMESCQGDEFPERWLATVTGVETTDVETRNWELKMVLVRHGDPATTHLWKQESVTGSFAISGQDDRCTWTHNGELGSNDFTGDLGLVPSQDLYWLDVVAGGYGDRKIACDGGAPGSTSTYFQAWGATDGGPDAIAWDRTRREITGTWDKDGYPDRHVEWVVTPMD
jgi:Ca2+-binding RTX toxin-like protein